MPLNLKEGDKFPDATLSDHSGEPVSISELGGVPAHSHLLPRLLVTEVTGSTAGIRAIP